MDAGTGATGPTLQDFAGRWTLHRRIEDRLGAQTGTFEGTATLEPDGAGLLYRETGWLSLGGRPAVRGDRGYLWTADGARIAVAFADGRPFHAFDPAAPYPAAEHLCGADLYRVRYAFADWPAWRAVWEVRGPRKDHRLESVYRRA